MGDEKDAQILQNKQALEAIQSELEGLKKSSTSSQSQQAEKEKRLVVIPFTVSNIFSRSKNIESARWKQTLNKLNLNLVISRTKSIN